MTHVVVVGAGISGLSAAYELTGGLAASSSAPAVTVLEAAEVGGMLACATVGGRTVDVGPDAFLARRPEAVALVGELCAADELIPIAATGAWVYARGRLRRLPASLALGVPTRLGAREAVGMLGLRGALRAAEDLVAPRPASRSPLPDRAIGPLVADKLGQRVVDVLVDPLVGGIHAGRVRDLSAAAVFPPLLAAGQQRGSLMRALRSATGARSEAAPGPVFVTLRDGAGSLPGLVADVLKTRGVPCETGRQATLLRRGAAGAPRWIVETPGGDLLADAVILATPAAVTSALLGPLDGDAAAMLGAIDAASVAVVTLRFAAVDVALPEEGTGVLVPGGTEGPSDAYLVTAVSFLDRKWPHLGRDGETLLRASVGRIDDTRFQELDDNALVERVTDELAALLEVQGAPLEALVTRWPDAFPQYRVNHLVRVEGVEAAAATLGGVAVAGAAYRGVGVPACIASGRAAARAVRTWLVGQS
ncbi:MAG TPA: protoporphyrinogen oxidase [Acidimicrobiales bacterium]|nr:protoporphyrinogen oxidase [Acidimicrobiales bacterium]